MVGLTLKHGLCEESVYSFIQYSSIMCQRCRDLSDIQEACRIVKLAMSLMRRFSSPEIVPKVFACYYGFVAVHSEPLRLCADNLRRGFDGENSFLCCSVLVPLFLFLMRDPSAPFLVGISGAGALNFAFFNSVFLVRNALLSGGNLLYLRKEVDYHLDIMARFKHTVFKDPLLAFRETISKLTDKAQFTSLDEDVSTEKLTFDSMNTQRRNAISFFNTVLQSFWLGHSDRCEHYAKKALNLKLLGSHNFLLVLFYSSLNALRVYRKGKKHITQLSNLRLICKKSIDEMSLFATLSPSNYCGKVLLLEAELHSLENKEEEAKFIYSDAISAFSSTGYVHEQGLACELAGFHYIRINQPDTALDFFLQAHDCYVQWGSKMKVEFISQQISRLTLLQKPERVLVESEFCLVSPKGPSFLTP